MQVYTVNAAHNFFCSDAESRGEYEHFGEG